MKKSIGYLSLLIILVLITTACGTKEETKKEEPANDINAKEVLTTTLNNMGSVETLSMNMNFDMKMEFEGSTISMSGTSYREYDSEEKYYTKTEMAMMGMTYTDELYGIIKDGFLYEYSSADEDTWYYEVYEYEDTSDIEENETFLEYVTDIKEVESDKEGYIKITTTLETDKMFELFEIEDAESKSNEYSTINFYIKDNYIYFMEFDASDVMQYVMLEEGLEFDGIDFTGMEITCFISVEFANFNEIEPIIVPDSIIKNAIPLDEGYSSEEQVVSA